MSVVVVALETSTVVSPMLRPPEDCCEPRESAPGGAVDGEDDEPRESDRLNDFDRLTELVVLVLHALRFAPRCSPAAVELIQRMMAIVYVL